MSTTAMRYCFWLGSTLLALMAAVFVSVWLESVAFGLPSPLYWARWALLG